MSNESRSSSFAPGTEFRSSENLFLPAQIPSRTKIGDEQHNPVLVLAAHRAERKLPVFEPDAAARAVVGNLRHLILEVVLRQIVADTNRSIPSGAIHLAVPDQRLYLVC